MGIGIVVRDHSGFVIAARGKRMIGTPEPVQAEALGALMAAELSRDLGLPDVILEGDSLLVVQALRKMSPNLSSYGQVIEDTRSILFTRRSWMVNHVKREVNSAAHYLAKDALLFNLDRVWMEECPQCIVSIISLEQLLLLFRVL